MNEVREKLIELLDDIQRCGEDFDDYEIYGMRLPDSVSNDDVADHLIANGVTIQKWVPVTERLPESGKRVIVCRGDKVEQGVYLGVNGWWKVYGANTKAVTHWMPLPEPPKEEK